MFVLFFENVTLPSMKAMITKEEFKDYIVSAYSISENDFERLMDEVNHFYDYEFQSYIQSRHLKLKENGLNNQEIYQILQKEIKEQRFRAPTLSERQIRRIIYG